MRLEHCNRLFQDKKKSKSTNQYIFNFVTQELTRPQSSLLRYRKGARGVMAPPSGVSRERRLGTSQTQECFQKVRYHQASTIGKEANLS